MRAAAPFVLVAVGFSFWFWVGFPFGHHNESYAWAGRLEHTTLRQALTERLETVATFRPAAQAVAWLLYRGSGGSTIPVQLWNYAVALLAWGALLAGRRERSLLALLAPGAGLLFFAGYIYLFHLHGVFYGPLLLLVALLLRLFEEPPEPRRLLVVTGLVSAAALFHPFAWVVGAATTAAAALGRVGTRSARASAVAASLFMAACALWSFGSSGAAGFTLHDRVRGALASYRTTEAHPAVAVAALALALLAGSGSRGRWLVAGSIGAIGALFLGLGLPLTLIWLGVCCARAALAREAWLVGLIVATATLPLAAPTGSPTYAIFAVMTCVAATARFRADLEPSLAPVVTLALVPAALALVALPALRAGINVPVLSRLARPVLAESERTHQLEATLRFILSSPYRDREVRLERSASNPAVAADAVDRTHRAPTSQRYLDEYLDGIRGRASGGSLTVHFGGENCGTGTPILSIAGRTAGTAITCADDPPVPQDSSR